MNKRLRLPLALSLALGSSSAMALGLGQIEVKSVLNQPLSAEIPVLSTQPGETDALVVRLAPPEALARVGLQAPSGVAANLEFAVDTNARGEKVIRVTTPDKVADPFVTFLLEVDWGSGKMLREYTLLLDPPTMAPVRHTATAAPVSAPTTPSDAETVPLAEVPPPPQMQETPEAEPAAETPATSESEPAAEAAPEAVAEQPPVETPPAPEPEPARARTDNYGPVQEGETLWQIAQFARPDDSVTMNQMMLALLYANPDAFIGQNINRLKRGAILRIPAKEEALAVAAAEAAAQVREQALAWRGETPSVPQPAETQPDQVTDTRTPSSATAAADSRLELVPPRRENARASGAQSGATMAGQGTELRADLARSREQLSTLTQENVELKARVDELEKIQGDSAKLIELKDSELAAAQKRLAELEARTGTTSTTDAVPPADTPPAANPNGIDPSVPPLVETPSTNTAAPANIPTRVKPAGDTATPADAGTPPAATSTTATPAAPPTTTRTKPATETAPPPPAPQPIWMNPWVLGGVGLVIVGLLALLLGRRRAAAAGSSSPARYDSGAVASSIAAVQADAARRQADLSSGDEHLDEMVAAVSRDPGNLARHLELVRYYYGADDAAGFENAAEAMYSRVYDPEDLAWKQVVAMGQEIAPEHPLFIVTEVEPAVVHQPTPKAAPVATPPPVIAAPVVPKPAAIPPKPAVAAAPPVREIDWSQPAPKPAAAATQPMRVDEVRAAAKPAAPTFDDMPEPSDSFSFEPAPAEPDAGAGFVDADAASTKLELARAYLDMGDVEGARGMLEEVVSEGNPGQRAEAKRLLDEIR
jgi:pilus assembly protein FimV